MSKTALLVIDVQVGLVAGAYQEQQLISVVNRAITGVRQQGGLIIFIQHCHRHYQPLKVGQPGWQLHPELHRNSADKVLQKQASDAFYLTDLNALLTETRVSDIVITGLQTEFCVDATCRSALSKGFAVTLVADGHSTGDSHLDAATIINHHNRVLANLAHPTAAIAVKASGDLFAELA